MIRVARSLLILAVVAVLFVAAPQVAKAQYWTYSDGYTYCPVPYQSYYWGGSQPYSYGSGYWGTPYYNNYWGGRYYSYPYQGYYYQAPRAGVRIGPLQFGWY